MAELNEIAADSAANPNVQRSMLRKADEFRRKNERQELEDSQNDVKHLTDDEGRTYKPIQEIKMEAFIRNEKQGHGEFALHSDQNLVNEMALFDEKTGVFKQDLARQTQKVDKKQSSKHLEVVTKH